MSKVYIDEPAHSNKERRELKQVVSHTEENALILRQNNLTFLLIFSIYIRFKKNNPLHLHSKSFFFKETNRKAKQWLLNISICVRFS